MIGYLQGMVLRASPERLLVDVHGVGYEVHIPLSTFYEIERTAGPFPAGIGGGAGGAGGAGAEPRTVRLFIHTHMRDDGIALFGFSSEREKLLFERLIAVSGIGPRLARVVLSGMAVDDLLAALAAGDLGRLATIPGIGRKTAERLVLELRDKVRDLAAGAPPSGAGAAGEEVVSALVNLGYKPAQAERAVAEARREQPDAPFQDLLRASLGRLGRG
jgi:Holliday junction DNA helicase RuvA